MKKLRTHSIAPAFLTWGAIALTVSGCAGYGANVSRQVVRQDPPARRNPQPIPTQSVIVERPLPEETVVAPGPAVTQTVPGPTVTQLVPTPGPTVTQTIREPGPTVTQTITEPGPTVTQTIREPGPTVTFTFTPPPVETCNENITVGRDTRETADLPFNGTVSAEPWSEEARARLAALPYLRRFDSSHHDAGAMPVVEYGDHQSTSVHVVRGQLRRGRQLDPAREFATLEDAHMRFRLPILLPPSESIHSIRDVILEVTVNKAIPRSERNRGHDHSHTDPTEILCFANERLCSGRVINSTNWHDHVNPAFFPNSFIQAFTARRTTAAYRNRGMLPNTYFSREMVAATGANAMHVVPQDRHEAIEIVRRENVQLSLGQLIQGYYSDHDNNDNLSDRLKAFLYGGLTGGGNSNATNVLPMQWDDVQETDTSYSRGMYVIVADDTYIESANLKFEYTYNGCVGMRRRQAARARQASAASTNNQPPAAQLPAPTANQGPAAPSNQRPAAPAADGAANAGANGAPAAPNRGNGSNAQGSGASPAQQPQGQGPANASGAGAAGAGSADGDAGASQ